MWPGWLGQSLTPTPAPQKPLFLILHRWGLPIAKCVGNGVIELRQNS